MINKLKSFLQEAKQELMKVNWPSRQETVKLTIVVIIFSLGLSVYLGILDFGFGSLLKQLLP
ncbi:MAG: preprotein translocase subunit SecE [Candidatus Pacebacteria bacterium]|nr:preprotein translocase subunit SecE [Candidatus Paceibacterota bacterium]